MDQNAPPAQEAPTLDFSKVSDLKGLLVALTESCGKIEKKIDQQGETLRKDVAALGEKLKQEVSQDFSKLREEVRSSNAKWKSIQDSLETRMLQVETALEAAKPTATHPLGPEYDARLKRIEDSLWKRPPAPASGSDSRQIRALNDRLNRMEQQDRLERRNNITVKGMSWEDDGEIAAAAEFLVHYFGIEHGVQPVSLTGKNNDIFIIKLKTSDMKSHILKNKYVLRGTGYYVEGDQTRMQREAQKKLRDLRNSLKAKGHDVKVAFDRIYIDGTKHTWNYATEELFPDLDQTVTAATGNHSLTGEATTTQSTPKPRSPRRSQAKNYQTSSTESNT